MSGSQILCYRDSSIALELIADSHSLDVDASRSSQYSKPDELLSVKNAIAVYDASYHKVGYTHIKP